MASEQNHRSDLTAPTYLGGGGGQLAVGLPVQQVGGHPVQHQRADSRMAFSNVDADELAHCQPSSLLVRRRAAL